MLSDHLKVFTIQPAKPSDSL